MKTKQYDVVLLPETKIALEAIKASEELASHKTCFTLNNETCFPHVSLYMLNLDTEGLEEAKKILGVIASKNKKLEAVAADYHYSHEYLDIEYDGSKLAVVQNQVLEKLNPFRKGLRQKDTERLINATGEAKDNLLKYGYKYINNLFRPHLTLTRFKNEQAQLPNALPAKDLFSGELTELGIFEMGEHGTCVNKINTWDL